MPSAFFNLAWVLLLFSCLSSIAECEKKLKFVHALWRHGDRAPSKKPYPLDPYDERYWPRGWNQLTNLGMRQMNELGKYAKNIERVTNNYKQLFDFLGNVTGVGSGVTFDTVVELYDIVREVHNNLTQPDWVYKTWPEYGGNTTLNLILEIQRLWRFYEFSHHPSAYLRGGLLLGDWLHRASNVSCGRYKNPSKMVLYSSHEGTMHSLLHNLEVSNNNLVPYSACIIMEIYKNEHDHLEIELLYRTLQNGGRTEVIVPKNCTSPCPLTKFFDIYKSKAIFTIEKLYEECGLKYCEQGHMVDEFDD